MSSQFNDVLKWFCPDVVQSEIRSHQQLNVIHVHVVLITTRVWIVDVLV